MLYSFANRQRYLITQQKYAVHAQLCHHNRNKNTSKTYPVWQNWDAIKRQIFVTLPGKLGPVVPEQRRPEPGACP